MRPYAELLTDERKKLFRIMTLIFCGGQMFSLLIRFSHHWSRMESIGHWTAVECLLLYPSPPLSPSKRMRILSSLRSWLTA